MANTNYLIHYGVKGMKWGVRKDPVRTGQRRAKREKTLNTVRNYTGSRGSKALSRARKQDINKMSNQELQDTITRLNLEKQYRSLTKVDFMAGQKIANNVLKYVGTTRGIGKLIPKKG